MVGRILLGERSGISGLFVSRAGAEVATATGRDLLIDPTRKQIQVIYERRLELGEMICDGPTSLIARQVAHPDFGFSPMVMMSVVADAYAATIASPFTTLAAASPRVYDKSQTGFWLRMLSSNRDGVYKTWATTIDIRLFNIVSTNSETLSLPRDAYGDVWTVMQRVYDT